MPQNPREGMSRRSSWKSWVGGGVSDATRLRPMLRMMLCLDQTEASFGQLTTTLTSSQLMECTALLGSALTLAVRRAPWKRILEPT